MPGRRSNRRTIHVRVRYFYLTCKPVNVIEIGCRGENVDNQFDLGKTAKYHPFLIYGQ